jgi:hypothetical protein
MVFAVHFAVAPFHSRRCAVHRPSEIDDNDGTQTLLITRSVPPRWLDHVD